MADRRIPIHEVIAWRDAEGRAFQTWDVYEAVRDERNRLRNALEQLDGNVGRREQAIIDQTLRPPAPADQQGAG